MKKILSILLAVLMLSAVCISAFAMKNDQTMITSDEQWWDWFKRKCFWNCRKNSCPAGSAEER